MAKRYKIICAVFIHFIKNNKIACIRRVNTGWNDGLYTLPSGHVEEGESIIQSAIREAKEEVGINLKPKQLKLVHVTHRNVRKGNDPRVDFHFLVTEYKGIVKNNEPSKCDDVAWFDLGNLPKEKMLYFLPTVIKDIQNDISYSDWDFK